MTKPDQYTITYAANSLLKLIREADDQTLDAAYQALATWANNSEYASSAEPLAYIAQALGAEGRKRLLDAAEVNRCYHGVDRGTCAICLNEPIAPTEGSGFYED